MSISLVLAALSPRAEAFCGTYIGQAGADLTNSASQLAIARQNGRTTLTMVNDYEGELSDFAFVIPVPSDLQPEDVRVVETHLVRTVEVYSGPRLVQYECADYGGWERIETKSTKGHTPLFALPFATLGGCSDSTMANSDMGMGGSVAAVPSDEADSAVTVEAEFAAGEYEFVLVSADDGEGLMSWLDANGYSVGEHAEEVLGSYIASGSSFLAAKVSLEAVPAGMTNLSPIQISYMSEGFSLPIRLGTLNSGGEQDLIVYTVTPYEDGQVGIANYPRAVIDDECLLRTDEWDSFADYYNHQFDLAFEESDGFTWVAEYGWAVTPSWMQPGATSFKCDPCPAPELFPSGAPTQAPGEDYDPLPDETIEALGFRLDREQSNDTGWWGIAPEFYVSRIHMRYTPEAVDQDLVLYTSGLYSNDQIRFIDYAPYLEDQFPICGEGWAPDPGSCEYGPAPDPKWGLIPMAGCSTLAASSGTGLAGLAGLLGFALLSRRRK
ncbi:MAG TPA: DUF2330 domain-containing protein [Myxococcota bacterium]|nr:DUF2330 domain-containing protein [Myxococcota bacterium]